mgnify:CR=1 FL=1
MKKFFFTFISFVFLVSISLITILSTVGIKTNKFNKIIEKKINQSNNNINLELTIVKFRLDIKQISLFLETNSPKLNFKDTIILVENIKVYTDFISLIKTNPKIRKINLDLNQLNIEQLKKISINLKPSNLTSFVNNKTKQGKLNIELEIYFKNNLVDNFIARGSVLDLTAEIIKDIDIKEAKFNFFADKSDILLTNIFGNIEPFKIIKGDLKLVLSSDISIESNFKTKIKYDNKSKNLNNLSKYLKITKNITNLDADLNNSFKINFDKTYKVKNYNYKNNGKILNAMIKFEKPLENYFSKEKVNQLVLLNSEIKTIFSNKKKSTNISGKYILNENNPLKFSLENIIDNEFSKLKVDAVYKNSLEFKPINYKKKKNIEANISFDLEKKKENIWIKKFNYIEGINNIFLEDIKFNKDNFLSFKRISVKTSKDEKINNDFHITYGEKIELKGNQLDASNLPKIFKQQTKKNLFLNINKDIEIDLANVGAPLSENLKNFKLIGKIEKGKFTKINSKGDFGGNNFLDILMKKNENDNKKYLEIYSDLTRPLLTEYNFFKGLTGGKLLYTAIIDGENYNSKLKIEKFKLINAPGMIKLLSLADLGGLADLTKGDGLSFDILEINLEKNNNLLKLNEILALGPSVSILMDGYMDKSVTSLRGTLVPAKTLNQMISKIPVLGDVIIPKEAGEGLFGISFKMKGPPGKVKTTINPIRTLTPRFIQKILDKKKTK